ncbi:hypothetical protein FRC10_008784 [Ceratobasidium sp. 414]|nr:hypothetical protein FRC10_008784 [Ceratobasidium sp. 414]
MSFVDQILQSADVEAVSFGQDESVVFKKTLISRVDMDTQGSNPAFTVGGHSLTLHSGIPFIVPHALGMFLFWNSHIWFNYAAYYNSSQNFNVLSRIYFWYGFVFIWDGVGMWTSAFGTLYVTLLPKLFVVTPSNHTKFEYLLLHPITLNTLCFFAPFGFALTQVVTSIYCSKTWNNNVHTQFKLVDVLTTLASPSTTGDAHTSLLSQATDLGNLLLVQMGLTQTAFIRNAGICKYSPIFPLTPG